MGRSGEGKRVRWVYLRSGRLLYCPEGTAKTPCHCSLRPGSSGGRERMERSFSSDTFWLG